LLQALGVPPPRAERARPSTRAVVAKLHTARVRNGIDLPARLEYRRLSQANEAGPPKKFLRRGPRLFPARPRSNFLLRIGLEHSRGGMSNAPLFKTYSDAPRCFAVRVRARLRRRRRARAERLRQGQGRAAV